MEAFNGEDFYGKHEDLFDRCEGSNAHNGSGAHEDPKAKVLVEANAGTGKTYQIVELYVNLLLNVPDLRVEQILVVTFTKAATAELKKRIREKLAALAKKKDKKEGGEELAEEEQEHQTEIRRRARMAMYSFDLAPIHTIHGFCQRALDEFAFESGATPDSELIASGDDLIAEIVRDFYIKNLNAGKEVGKFDDLLKIAKSAFREPRPMVVPNFAESGESPDMSDLKSRIDSSAHALVEAVENAGYVGGAFDAALDLVRPQLPGKSLSEQVRLISATFDGNKTKKSADPVRAVKEAKEKYKNAVEELERAVERAKFSSFFSALGNDKTGYSAKKRFLGVLTYDDLLANMKQALEDDKTGEAFAEALRKTYKYAIVDEFQDTDSTQYAIFDKVFNHEGHALFMVGDPKQAIYSFRSGDVATYKKAFDSVAEERILGLNRNFRSSPGVIKSVNELFKSDPAMPPPFLDPRPDYVQSRCGNETNPKWQMLFDDKEVEKPYRLLWMTGKDGSEPLSKTGAGDVFLRRTASEIAKMLREQKYKLKHSGAGKPRRLRPGDFAVLLETNDDCLAVKNLLSEKGIPAVVLKSGNVFKSSVAKDLMAILNAMLHAQNIEKVKAALLVPWCGKTLLDVAAMTGDGISEEQEKFERLGAVWRKKGVVSAISEFIREYSAMENIAARQDMERLVVNERHLSELLGKREEEGRLEPEGLFKFLRSAVSGGESDQEEYEERLESDAEAVSIITVFKAKGLEFPIVFCPTVSVGYRPKEIDCVHDKDGNLVFPVTKVEKETHKGTGRYESFCERLRLLYVALTRASAMCVMVGGDVKHGNGKKEEAIDKLTAFHYLLWRAGNPDAKVEEGKVPKITSIPLARAKKIFDVVESPYETFAGGENEASANPPQDADVKQQAEIGDALDFNRVITVDFGVTSYSGMVRHVFASPDEESAATGGSASEKDPSGGTDEVEPPPEEEPAPAEAASDGFVLPGGKATGLAVHKIFEKVDYLRDDDWTGEINKALRDNNLEGADEEETAKRTESVRKLVKTTLDAKLPGCGFSLNEIEFANTKREWKFFSAMDRKPDLAPFKEIGLAFKEYADAKKGCITGEIDLVFRRDGKYYFADWKTDRLSDYSPARLEEEMKSRGYLFQAYVYAIALRDLLRQRLGEEFDFAKHFGGGFYCFVRGISDGDGIYRFNPSEEELDKYAACFREVDANA